MQAVMLARATLRRAEVDARLTPTRSKLQAQLDGWLAFVQSNRRDGPEAQRVEQPAPLAVFSVGEEIGRGGQGGVYMGRFWPMGRGRPSFRSAIKLAVVDAADLRADPVLFFTESMVVAAQSDNEFITPMQACDVRPHVVSARIGWFSRDAAGRETFEPGEEQHGLPWSKVEARCSALQLGSRGAVIRRQPLWEVVAVTQYGVYHLMEPYACAPLVRFASELRLLIRRVAAPDPAPYLSWRLCRLLARVGVACGRC